MPRAPRHPQQRVPISHAERLRKLETGVAQPPPVAGASPYSFRYLTLSRGGDAVPAGVGTFVVPIVTADITGSYGVSPPTVNDSAHEVILPGPNSGGAALALWYVEGVITIDIAVADAPPSGRLEYIPSGGGSGGPFNEGTVDFGLPVSFTTHQFTIAGSRMLASSGSLAIPVEYDLVDAASGLADMIAHTAGVQITIYIVADLWP